METLECAVYALAGMSVALPLAIKQIGGSVETGLRARCSLELFSQGYELNYDDRWAIDDARMDFVASLISGGRKYLKKTSLEIERRMSQPLLLND